MVKKLIFLDVDGTLTAAGTNTPPESALEAIRRARAAGHKVFLCSGRNLGMLSPLLAYGFDGAVASAGGYVVCGKQVLYDHPMTAAQLQTALDTLHRGGAYCTIEGRDAAFGDDGLAEFLEKQENCTSEMLRWRMAVREELGVRPIAEYDGRPIYKVVFMYSRPEQLMAARAALETEFSFCCQAAPRSIGLNGELINRAFDKGHGVRTVCRHLGVDVADTIGFGDSMNDFEMIQTVGIGVCMENGCQELKGISGRICPPAEQDGLARAFQQLGLI